MRGFGANMSGLTQSVKDNLRDLTDEEMNLLQEHGIISDNCVTWSDVALCDRDRARQWLTGERTLL